VAAQAQRGGVGILPLDADDQRGSLGVAGRASKLNVEPTAIQVSRQKVGVATLSARIGGSVVHALVADELLDERHDLAPDRRHFSWV
jgi:hypothetical protein